MDAQYESIYLLVSDLGTFRRNGVANYSGPGTIVSPSKFVFVSILQHWSLQVRDSCYELARSDDIVNGAVDSQIKPRISTFAEWKARRERHNTKFEKLKVGATSRTDEQIKEESMYIHTFGRNND
jgi:hypothetical protein